MPRKKTNKQVEEPFVSIEEDARLLGIEVQLKGMDKQEAQKLAKEINACELDIDVEIERAEGTGRKQYKREGPNRPALVTERDYEIVDAQYYLRIEHEGETICIENKRQWELWNRINQPAKRARDTIQDEKEAFIQQVAKSIRSTKKPKIEKKPLPRNEDFSYLDMLEYALDED